MKNIFSKQGIVDTYVDDQVIKVFWKQLSDKEALYDSCTAQLEFVQQGHVQIIIIDISTAEGAPPREIQTWFANILFPGYKACPQFKGMINVLPSKPEPKMGAKRWKAIAESEVFGFTVYETEEMVVAEEMVKEMIS